MVYTNAKVKKNKRMCQPLAEKIMLWLQLIIMNVALLQGWVIVVKILIPVVLVFPNRAIDPRFPCPTVVDNCCFLDLFSPYIRVIAES